MQRITLITLALAACTTASPPSTGELQAQRVRVGNATEDGSYLSFHLLSTLNQAALPCADGTLEASIRYRTEGGSWQDLPSQQLLTRCDTTQQGDVALVLDNSGSEAGHVDAMRAGATAMADELLGAGREVSVVRVSTQSEVLSPVSADADAIHTAIDSLQPTDGWTALYDGIRMGNETLGGAVQARQVAGVWPDLTSFCDASEPLGIVAFTDGRENNSADQQQYDHDAYPGDACDTTLAQLHNLRVGDTTTPIYTIGLGDEPDHDALRDLAESTGAQHLALGDSSEVEGAFAALSEYFDSSAQVCAELPSSGCGDVELELNYSWTDGQTTLHGSETTTVDIPCPIEDEPAGRMAMFVLTISKPSIGTDVSSRLITQAVDWVSPVDDARVLVVLDDGRRFEFPTDPVFVTDTLREAGWDVDSVEEPSTGLRPSDLVGYDVVWFANPGWPLDDRASRDALLQYQSRGGGLVLQGDDITYALGQAFSMSPLTKVQFVHNGTPYCGVRINNNTGNYYEVSVVDETHPVTAGLEGMSFLYNDDIDVTRSLGLGEQVLAWANLPGGSDCASHPAIVVFDPEVASE